MKPEKKTKSDPQKEFALGTVLSAIIIVIAIRRFFDADYENVFTCIVALVLLGLPRLITERIGVILPRFLESMILLFIFAAEILGEVAAYYQKFPYWDTMLHTINGFLMAAIGFALVDIFNRSDRFLIKLSPMFVAVVAFCFSMTIGVLWEFFEFSMDSMFHTDMQKDFFVTTINSTALDPAGGNTVIHTPINSLVVNGEDWLAKYGGYLDIGIIDTMKDLFVNFIGAVVFSVIGFFYVKHRGQGNVAPKFIPVVKREGDDLDSFGNPIDVRDSIIDDIEQHREKRIRTQKEEEDALNRDDP